MQGFTLTELLVTLAITLAIGSIVVTPYQNVLKTADASHAAFVYTDALREAQGRALQMEHDTAWGLAIVGNTTVVFSGASYAARVTSRDKVYALPSSITVTGGTSTIFAKFTGVPSAVSTTTFSNTFASSSVFITSGGSIVFAL